MDLATVDLNLLVVLDALLTEGSVTRAARRLARTQSATSHALARLRTTFDDPLLVRAGRQLVPTARAEQLREPLARLLADVDGLLRGTSTFDPATTQAEFRLAAPDLLAGILPELLVAISQEAPLARFTHRPPLRGGAAEPLASGVVDLELAPMPRHDEPGVRARPLGSVSWCVACRRGHPLVSSPDVDTWLRFPHVQIATGNDSRGFVGETLDRMGLTRRIGVRTPTFLMGPHIVSRTDHVLTAPRELLTPLADTLGLVLLPPPIPLPSTPIAALWHERRQNDPAHHWFRDLVTDTLARALRQDNGRSPSVEYPP